MSGELRKAIIKRMSAEELREVMFDIVSRLGGDYSDGTYLSGYELDELLSKNFGE